MTRTASKVEAQFGLKAHKSSETQHLTGGGLRTCLKKKKSTQELMFMLNHWRSKILT